METRESQREKRVQDVIQGKEAGGGKSPTASAMRAREEIQGIEAERAANLDRQKAMMASRTQQMNTMKQAALIGAAGMAQSDSPKTVALQQQAAAMNPGTQAILQKYGVKPGQTQRVVSSSSTQNIGPTRITTNNNTRNEIKIVQPQIPMRQQVIPMAAKSETGNLNKFKAWLDSSFAKQANEYEIQQKEFRRKEWNLARNSSKLFQKLSESTKSLGEKMDPRNMGATLGGQLKTLLFLFLATTINKWWGPLMDRISSIDAGFRAVFGIPMDENLKSTGKKGISFVDKIKEFIGIDTKTEAGKNTNLLQGIYNIVKDGFDRLKETLELFIADRRLAIQKINLPEFKLPDTNWNPLGKMIGSAFQNIMAPATEYLGNIFSALVGGSKGIQNKAARNVKNESVDSFKRSSGGMYFTRNSTDFMGNLKSDSTYGMSMLLSDKLRDKSNTLHTGEIMTGLNMLESTAKRSGFAVINPDMLRYLGIGDNTIAKLLKNKEAEYVPYKLIKVPKSSAESSDFSKGTLTDHIVDSSIEEIGDRWKASKKGFRIGGGPLSHMPIVGSLMEKGNAIAAGEIIGSVKGTYNYIKDNSNNSNYVYKAVPLSDPTPGEKINLLSITKEGFNTLKKDANIDSFDLTNQNFQRWVEGRERAQKVAMGVRGNLRYGQKSMNALNQAHTMRASYESQMHEIWNDPNRYGRGDIGNWVDLRDNTAKAVANGMSWAANGLSDINFRLTGRISPQHIPAGEARENAIRGIKYLMEKYHLSKEAAAGIAGVIQRESGWNPGAQNQQEKAKGYKGFGRGLCQWSNDWGIRAFPEWYESVYGVKKYPDEVPLEHQLDYLMTGLSQNGGKKEEFLRIIHKPGVTVEEATRAMLLGYENGGKNLASFSDLAKVKAYGGVSGVNRMYANRASSALGFYNLIGKGELTGFSKSSDGSYSFNEDAVDLENDTSGIWKVSNVMTESNGGWDLSKLELAETEDIKETIANENVTDNLKLGDWFVGRSIRYLVGNVKPKSVGYCAKHVRLALKAGGINDTGHPAAATDYIKFLPKRGFARIPDGSSLQPGDICVQLAGGTHRYGHICMYTGKSWVSDFVQKRMIVYNNGNWPYVLFRYTGKGGTGSDSLIDESMNYIEAGLDATGRLIGGISESLGNASDAINPGQISNSFDTSSLSASQLLTYNWAKTFEGVKEDKSGLYIDDKKNGYRHYINLNSEISNTGLLQLQNIQGTYKLKNGVAYEPVNNSSEELVSKNAILSDVAGRLIQAQGSGIVIDYTLPIDEKYIPSGMSSKAQKYFSQKGGFTYNVYDVTADGTAFNTILVPTVPLLQDSISKVYYSPFGGGANTSEMSAIGMSSNGEIVYPREYELTGTPKKGWNILYSRTKQIKSNISGKLTNYEWSPYLKGALGIDISEEAIRTITSILEMIRGEKDLDSSLSKSLGELMDKYKKAGSEKLAKTLGIDTKSILESAEIYKSGKDKDRYRIDSGGNILDTKLGISIGNKNSDILDTKEKAEKYFNDIKDNLPKIVNDNLKKITALDGFQVVNSNTSYERYNTLYGNSVFGNKEDITELKKQLAGKTGESVEVTSNLAGLRGAKFDVVIDENGNKRYILNQSSIKGDVNDSLYKLEGLLKNEDLWSKVRTTGISLDDLKNIGINLKDHEEKVNWSNLEELLRTTGLDRDKVLKAKDTVSVTRGLKTIFSRDDEQERLNSLIQKYNDNGGNAEGYSKEGDYVYFNDSSTGRKEAVGKVVDGKAVKFESGEEYSNANRDLILNKSFNLIDYRDKISWYAAKFGAKPIGSGDTGEMYIDLHDGTVFKFNVNDLGANDDIKSILKSKKGTFFKKTGNKSSTISKFGDNYEWKPVSEINEDSFLSGAFSLAGKVGGGVIGLKGGIGGAISGFAAGGALGSSIGAGANSLINGTTSSSLESKLEDLINKRTEEESRRDFGLSWDAQEIAERVRAVTSEDSGLTLDSTNAYLSDLENLTKSEVNLLGIIATNTAKEDQIDAIKELIDKNTNVGTINDQIKKDEYTNVFSQALTAAGSQNKGLLLNDLNSGYSVSFDVAAQAAAQHLGVSIDELKAVTGINGLGKWGKSRILKGAGLKLKGATQQTTPPAPQQPQQVTPSGTSNSGKAQAKIVETQQKTAEMERSNAVATAQITSIQADNADKFTYAVDNLQVATPILERSVEKQEKLYNLLFDYLDPNKNPNGGGFFVVKQGDTYVTNNNQTTNTGSAGPVVTQRGSVYSGIR